MNKVFQGIIFLAIISMTVGAVVYFSKTVLDTQEEKVEHDGQNSANQEEDKEENTEELLETKWQWIDSQKKLYELS